MVLTETKAEPTFKIVVSWADTMLLWAGNISEKHTISSSGLSEDRQHGPLKRHYPPTTLHGVRAKKNHKLIITVRSAKL
jgi:hypothetical protein